MALRLERKDSGKKWIALFLAFIMLASVAGFVLSMSPSSSGDNFRFAGHAFRQTPEGFYTAKISGKDITFFFRPENVEGVAVSPDVESKLTSTRAIFLSYEWNSSLGREMSFFQFDAAALFDAKGVFAQAAFSGPNPVNFTVKTCSDATPFMPVLVLQESNNNAIGLDSANPNCIVVNSTDSTSFLMIGDRIKYAVLAGNS